MFSTGDTHLQLLFASNSNQIRSEQHKAANAVLDILPRHTPTTQLTMKLFIFLISFLAALVSALPHVATIDTPALRDVGLIFDDEFYGTCVPRRPSAQHTNQPIRYDRRKLDLHPRTPAETDLSAHQRGA